MDKAAVSKYVNTFRNVFGTYLKPGVGMQIKISEINGEVFICFTLGISLENTTSYSMSFLNVDAALNHFGFKEVSGNDVTKNTLVFIQGNKLAIVKQNNNSSLSDEIATNDAQVIVRHIINSKKK